MHLPRVDPPRFRLYTPEHITMACFIGTPIASGWLMAHNWVALNRRPAAVLTMIVSILATGVVLVLGSFLRGPMAELVSLVMLTVVVHFLSRGLHGHLVENHREVGGPVASGYAAAARGVFTLVMVVAVGLAYRWVWRQEVDRFAPIDRHVRVDSGIVYLKGTATRTDARKLVDLFHETGYIARGRPFTLGLKLTEREAVVSVVVPRTQQDQVGLMEALDDFGRVLIRHGFGPPLEMRISDGLLRVHRQWWVAPSEDDEGG